MRRYLLSSLGLALFWGCAGAPPINADPTSGVVGIASYYAHKFHGRQTASGEIYNEQALTAAHRTLPFGTRVRVINLENGKHIDLEINDRGPFVKGRIIDVSYRAAQDLDFLKQGLVKVRMEILGASN